MSRLLLSGLQVVGDSNVAYVSFDASSGVLPEGLMTAAVEGRHGRVAKHTGDGMMAVFESPVDAVGGNP